MKKPIQIIAFLILCFLINKANSQSQESFNELIKETNGFLNSHSVLNDYMGSYDTFISFKESGLSKKRIESAIMNNDYEDGISKGKDSIYEAYLIEELNKLIKSNVYKIISHTKFKAQKIDSLLNGGINIVKSEDNKLYNFSFNEKTGGTYRSRISIMYFSDVATENQANQEKKEMGKLDPYEIFEGDGFNKIHSIPTKEGTKYVLESFVRGCSWCFLSSIMLVKFKDGVFHQDFLYSLDSRNPTEGIEYNSKTKKITVDYVTDDLTTDCYCNNSQKTEENSNEREEVKKKCHCTFQFNGLNFFLMKKGSEKVKE